MSSPRPPADGFRPLSSASVCRLLLAAILLSQTACVSGGAQDPAYTTIYSCVTAVQSAVSTFKAMKEDGRIVDADGSKEQRVRDAYRVFQQAAEVAIEMYRTPEQQRSALEVAQAAMRGALALIDGYIKGKP